MCECNAERAQNRAAKGSILKKGEILCPSGYISLSMLWVHHNVRCSVILWGSLHAVCVGFSSCQLMDKFLNHAVGSLWRSRVTVCAPVYVAAMLHKLSTKSENRLLQRTWIIIKDKWQCVAMVWQVFFIAGHWPADAVNLTVFKGLGSNALSSKS